MPDIASNNKRIAKNTLFLYGRMILVLFVSLYATRVVLNSLGVVDYGVYNVVAGFVSIFSFLNTSMSNGIQRFFNFKMASSDDGEVTKVYNTAVQIQLLLACFILLLLETFGIWYLNVYMVIPAERLFAAQIAFQCAVASLMLLITQIPYSAAIMAYEKMDFYAYVSVFEAIAKFGVAVAIANASADKLILYSVLLLCVSAITFGMYFGYAKHNFKVLALQKIFDKDLFKTMMSFSGWNLFGSFSYVIKGQGLNMLLNLFFGPVVNAARGIAYMILNAIQGFQSNIVVSFRPQLVKSYASQDFDRVRKLMYSVSKLSFMVLYLLIVPIVLELPLILWIWLGTDIPDNTIPFTVLVLANILLSSFNNPFSLIVHATGKMKTYQITTSIIICSILPIAYVLLKFGFGPVSVFWVSLVIVIINQVVCMFVVRKIFDYGIKGYTKYVILPCILFTFLMPIVPALCHFCLPQSIWRLAVVVFATVVLACIIGYSICLDNSEKQLVKEIKNTIIKR